MQLSVPWCRDSKVRLTNSWILTAADCGPSSPIHFCPFATLLLSSLCKSTICCWDVAFTPKHTGGSQFSPKTHQGMNNLHWSTSIHRLTICWWLSSRTIAMSKYLESIQSYCRPLLCRLFLQSQMCPIGDCSSHCDHLNFLCLLTSSLWDVLCKSQNCNTDWSIVSCQYCMFPFVITGHWPVHKNRIARFRRSYMEFCKNLMAVEIVSWIKLQCMLMALTGDVNCAFGVKYAGFANGLTRVAKLFYAYSKRLYKHVINL